MCMFCSRFITIFPGSVANLKRHISRIHKNHFQLIKKYAPNKYMRGLEKKPKDRSDSHSYMNSDYVTVPERFEELYFNLDPDGKFACKNCTSVFYCYENDQMSLVQHLQEAHPGLLGVHSNNEEFTIVIVKKKDLEDA